jgi:hypothetical protein
VATGRSDGYHGVGHQLDQPLPWPEQVEQLILLYSRQAPLHLPGWQGPVHLSLMHPLLQHCTVLSWWSCL